MHLSPKNLFWINQYNIKFKLHPPSPGWQETYSQSFLSFPSPFLKVMPTKQDLTLCQGIRNGGSTTCLHWLLLRYPLSLFTASSGTSAPGLRHWNQMYPLTISLWICITSWETLQRAGSGSPLLLGLSLSHLFLPLAKGHLLLYWGREGFSKTYCLTHQVHLFASSASTLTSNIPRAQASGQQKLEILAGFHCFQPLGKSSLRQWSMARTCSEGRKVLLWRGKSHAFVSFIWGMNVLINWLIKLEKE